MRTYEHPISGATETERQIRQIPNGYDKIVRPLFGSIAKVVWPIKTAAHLAAIAGTSERAAARWISGEIDPPAIIYATLWMEIIRSRLPK